MNHFSPCPSSSSSSSSSHKQFSPQCPIVNGKKVVIPTGEMPRAKPNQPVVNKEPEAAKPKPLAKFVQSLMASDMTVQV